MSGIISRAALWCGISLLTGVGSAIQFFDEGSLPSESLSSGCVGALVADVTCPRQVLWFGNGRYLSVEALEEACVDTCASSLRQWGSSVSGACGSGDVYEIGESRAAPASFIPTLYAYEYNKTCMQDGGRWCNNVAYEMSGGNATASDFRVSFGANETGPAARNVMRRQLPADPCDNCIIKQYQFQAGSPIKGGYALQSNYSSLTSSCSKTGFPLASSTTPFPQSPLPSPPPSASCEGRAYAIRAGDTCRSISEENRVGTAHLLADNRLGAFCVDFPAAGNLCIRNQCDTHVVQANDTCLSVASSHRLSQVQLYTWNPILGVMCQKMERSVGDSICVSPPGDDDFSTSTTTPPPVVTPTAAPVPANKASGTTDRCSRYYEVQPDEYCNLLVIKYSISLGDFLVLNQGVNANCTNLFALESYCVAPVGRIDQYPGHPDYLPPASSVPDFPYSNLPRATFTAPAITGLPVLYPLADGTRKDCFLYMEGSEIEAPPGFSANRCAAVAAGWGIEPEQLQNWNPSLSTNSSDCDFSAGARYCLLDDSGESIVPVPAPTPTFALLPIREGTATDCRDYRDVVPPWTCASVLRFHGLTIAQFYEWNPSVGPDCAGMWLGYRYCIKGEGWVPPGPGDEPTTGPSASPTPTRPPPPGPTHPGTVENCDEWHVIKTGDTCGNVAERYSITSGQFFEWNPAVSEDCLTNFWLDYAYCVGTTS